MPASTFARADSSPRRGARLATFSACLALSVCPLIGGCPLQPLPAVFEGQEALMSGPRDAAVAEYDPGTDTFIVLLAGDEAIFSIEDLDGELAAYETDTSPEDPERILPVVITTPTTDVLVKFKSGLCWMEGQPGEPFEQRSCIFEQPLEPFNADNFCAGDFDADTDQDVAVLFTDIQGPPSAPATIRIFLNDGAGVFTPGQVLALPVPFFGESLSAGDVTGDDRPDLLAVDSGETYVLACQPDASFLFVDTATGATSATPPTPLPGAKVGLITRFNGDNAGDILVCPASGGVTLRLGNGNGAFQAPVSAPGIFAECLVAEDFDADGLKDAAIAGQGPGVVSIYPGTPAGGLGAPLHLDASQAPDRLGVFYAPGDTRPDLFTVHKFNNVIQSYINTEKGWRVSDRVPFLDQDQNILQPQDATFADVNGDDFVDVVTIDSLGRLSFTLNAADGSGALLPTRARDVGPALGRVEALAPLAGQGDARRPIALSVFNSATAVVARLNTSVSPPVWTFPQVFDAPFAVTDIGAGDFNADGREDIAFSHAAGTGSFTVRFQSAAGAFDTQQNFAIGGGAWTNILVADLDNAPRSDVVLADGAGGVLRTLLSDGAGGFTPGFTTSFPPALSLNVATGDLNDDGRDEIVVGAGPGPGDSGSVRVLSLTPAGGLASTATIPTFARPVRVGVGDFNGDGRLDICFGSQAATTLSDGALGVILNTPTGIADGAPSYYYASGDTRWADVADLRDPISRARGGSQPALTAVVIGPSQLAPFESMTILDSLFVPLGAPCTGDANGDGVVDFLDLNIVLSDFGQSGAPGALGGDLDDDGDCDFVDLNIVLSAFGTSC